MTNNLHDDDWDAHLAEIRSRHNSTWSVYDLDDLASDAMARGFEERRQREGKLPPPPRQPKKSLTEVLIEIVGKDFQSPS